VAPWPPLRTASGGNRKSSAVHRRKSEGLYTTRRLVPEERRERRPDTSATRLSGPRYRGATPQRTLWVSTVILNATRSEAYWCMCITDVVGASEMEDKPRCRIKNRLQSPYEVLYWEANEHTVAIVQSGVDECDHQSLECGSWYRMTNLA